MRLSELFDRPIAFHRVFATITGSVAGGVYLSQLVYWAKRMKEKTGRDWWYQTADEWEDQTGIKRHKQDSIRKELDSLGIISTDLRGVPARMHFRLNAERLDDILEVIMADDLLANVVQYELDQGIRKATKKTERGTPKRANWDPARILLVVKILAGETPKGSEKVIASLLETTNLEFVESDKLDCRNQQTSLSKSANSEFVENDKLDCRKRQTITEITNNNNIISEKTPKDSDYRLPDNWAPDFSIITKLPSFDSEIPRSFFDAELQGWLDWRLNNKPTASHNDQVWNQIFNSHVKFRWDQKPKNAPERKMAEWQKRGYESPEDYQREQDRQADEKQLAMFQKQNLPIPSHLEYLLPESERSTA